MPQATIDGIPTAYEVVGSGPPLLLFAPGGFNAVAGNWAGFSVYARVQPVEHLAQRFTCILFDRREAGRSGGRVQRITWAHYAAQGKGLLDHLGIDRAHLMGGCQGCSPVIALAATHPQRVDRIVLYWPAGGAKYRIASQARFAHHLAYTQQEGLHGVAALARSTTGHFGQDPRLGPWGTLLRRDHAFAQSYLGQDPAAYQALVAGMARTLIDRDTVAGAEPEDLLQLPTPALIIPGQDDAHPTSAARYLAECLPSAHYWDATVSQQTATTVPPRILDFLSE